MLFLYLSAYVFDTLILNLIQSLEGGQLLVSGSQGPSNGVLVVRVPCPGIPRFRVSGPDFRLCHWLGIPRLNFLILKFVWELRHSLLHKDSKLLDWSK